jgi:hypothetical protein
MPMNQEVKAMWVAALRSGNYQQTDGQLHDGDGCYCCLGVLCDISGLGQWVQVFGEQVEYAVGTASANDIPPRAVLDWAGFPPGSSAINRIPTVSIDEDDNPLHDHNDAGKSFAEIADAIEAQL